MDKIYYVETKNRFNQILIFKSKPEAVRWCKAATRWNAEQIQQAIKESSKTWHGYFDIFPPEQEREPNPNELTPQDNTQIKLLLLGAIKENQKALQEIEKEPARTPAELHQLITSRENLQHLENILKKLKGEF